MKSNNLKIVLITNMNNNNYSLLRCFRKLGADVELHLMSNKIKRNFSHFFSEHNTWNIKKCSNHIKYVNIPNRLVSVIKYTFLWNIYFWLKYYLFFFQKEVFIFILMIFLIFILSPIKSIKMLLFKNSN